MVCACHAFYFGKTIRELRLRMGDYLYHATNGKHTTVGPPRHIGLYLRFQPNVARFLVLEIVPEYPRGGDWDSAILRRETHWIERLNALNPPGLNEALSYKPYL